MIAFALWHCSQSFVSQLQVPGAQMLHDMLFCQATCKHAYKDVDCESACAQVPTRVSARRQPGAPQHRGASDSEQKSKNQNMFFLFCWFWFLAKDQSGNYMHCHITWFFVDSQAADHSAAAEQATKARAPASKPKLKPTTNYCLCFFCDPDVITINGTVRSLDFYLQACCRSPQQRGASDSEQKCKKNKRPTMQLVLVQDQKRATTSTVRSLVLLIHSHAADHSAAAIAKARVPASKTTRRKSKTHHKLYFLFVILMQIPKALSDHCISIDSHAADHTAEAGPSKARAPAKAIPKNTSNLVIFWCCCNTE